MSDAADRILLSQVQAQINSGSTHVTVDAQVAGAASPEALEEVWRLLKLAGAEAELRE